MNETLETILLVTGVGLGGSYVWNTLFKYTLISPWLYRSWRKDIKRTIDELDTLPLNDRQKNELRVPLEKAVKHLSFGMYTPFLFDFGTCESVHAELRSYDSKLKEMLGDSDTKKQQKEYDLLDPNSIDRVFDQICDENQE